MHEGITMQQTGVQNSG